MLGDVLRPWRKQGFYYIAFCSPTYKQQHPRHSFLIPLISHQLNLTQNITLTKNNSGICRFIIYLNSNSKQHQVIKTVENYFYIEYVDLYTTNLFGLSFESE